MNNQKSVDVSKLKAMYQGNEGFFDWLKSRERGRTDTSFKRSRRMLYEKGVKLSTKEVADKFKLLQEAGAGRIIYGRGGKPSRFAWDFNLRSVAAAATGADIKIEKQAPTRTKLPEVEVPSEKPTPRIVKPEPARLKGIPSGLDHTVTIRTRGVEIQLPANLTDNESACIAKLVSQISIAS